MAFNVGSIIARMKLDTKGFSQGVKDALKGGAQINKMARDVSKSMKDMGESFAIAGGLVAAAGTLWVRNLVNVADKVELLELRMSALLGSQEQAAILFKDVSKFAAQVPFAFEEVAESATQLAGIATKGAQEVSAILPVIADLAAVSGLTMRQTTEQVIRMFSAGAGSADLFRERGTLAMIGFQAGVSISAAETKKILLEAFIDPESKFRETSKKLANTWTGLMSILGDKWFQFRQFVAETTVFEPLKNALRTLNGFIEANIDVLKEWIRQNTDLVRNIILGIPAIGAVVAAMGLLLIAMGQLLFAAAKVGTVFAIMWTKILAPALPLIGIIAGIGAALLTLRALWLQNFNGMQQVFGDFVESFQRAWNAASEKVVQFINNIFGDGWADAVEGLWKKFKWFANLHLQSWVGTSEFIQALWDSNLTDWEGAQKKFLGAFEQDFLTPMIGQAEEGGKKVLQALSDVNVGFRSVLVDEAKIAGDVWSAVRKQFEQDIQGMKAAMLGLFPEFERLFSQLTFDSADFAASSEQNMEKIVSNIKEIIASIDFGDDKGLKRKLVDAAKQESRELREQLRERLRDIVGNNELTLAEQKSALSALLEVNREKFAEIKAIIGETPQAMRDIERAVADLNRELAASPIKAFATSLREDFGSIRGFARRMETDTVGAIETMSQGMATSFKDILKGTKSFSEGFQDIMETLVDAVIEAVAKIVAEMLVLAALEGLKALFGGAGGFFGGGPVGSVLDAGGGASGSSSLIGATQSFQQGTDFVPRTGLFQLHEGEAVIPAAENATGKSPVNLTNINVLTPEAIATALSGREGEEVVLNIIDRSSLRSGAARQIINRG